MSDKITIQICRFDVPSKSAGKLINKESVKNVINSDRFKQNLAKGRVLSLLSHADRYAIENKDIPYEDQILISNYLAGYGKRAWIDESKNAFFGEIELANNDNGRLVKDMLKKGFDLSTSMSVSATADDKFYYVEDILSLGDFTTRPDLEAKVIKVDFSEKRLNNGANLVTFSQRIPNNQIRCNFSDDNYGEFNEDDDFSNPSCPVCSEPLDNCACYKPGVYSESTITNPHPKTNGPATPRVDTTRANAVDNLSPSLESGIPQITCLDTGVSGVDVHPIMCSEPLDMEKIHKGIPLEDQMSEQAIRQFMPQLTYTVQAQITTSFSIRDLILEWKMKPYMVLRKRINEVIQQCRACPGQDWINMNLDNLKAYFDSYLLTWVNSAISNDNMTFNIGMGLMLVRYGVKSKSITDLNRAVKRMKQNMKTSGFIQKNIQTELNTAFQAIEQQLYDYIDKKIAPRRFVIVENEDTTGKKK